MNELGVGEPAWDARFLSGSFSQVLMHELGHALGLKHSFEIPGLNADLDTLTYSLMSYTSNPQWFVVWDGGPSSQQYHLERAIPTTPMVLDIAAIQYLYGADRTTATGNDTYSWSNKKVILEAIYDAGGIDTFDLSKDARGSVINLMPGSYSSVMKYSLADQIAEAKARGYASLFSKNPEKYYTWENNVGIAFGTIIENVIGSAFSDVISGNDVANRIDGGKGADLMSGGRGDDTYFVDNVRDVVTELSSAGSDIINSTISYVLGANTEYLNLIGSAAINATGNGLANTLTGNSGANLLDGGTGADKMAGGAGNDTYYVDNAADSVTEVSSSGGVDKVVSSVNFILGINIEALSLAGTANANATGNALANVIVGNSGQNKITGGAGADTLTGGSNTDTFIYTALADSTATASDLITDLTDSSDKIDFSKIDGNSAKAGVQGFKIVDAFSHQAGELVLDYNGSTKITSLMLDVNGDGKADMLIRLSGDHEDFDRFIFGGG